MQIHLSSSEGQREGPYALEEVNRALANRKFNGTDYWAWYEGLSEWVPLHTIPGVHEQPEPAASRSSGDDVQPIATSHGDVVDTTPEAPAVSVQASEAPVADSIPMPTGLPFSALEQIFILTTGEGQAASRSPVTTSLLRDVIGEDWETIRQVVPRDAIARCGVLNEMGRGPTPPLVWRAMTAFKPRLLQQAREGMYRICIRTLRIETGDLVSVFLFYNKEKLK